MYTGIIQSVMFDTCVFALQKCFNKIFFPLLACLLSFDLKVKYESSVKHFNPDFLHLFFAVFCAWLDMYTIHKGFDNCMNDIIMEKAYVQSIMIIKTIFSFALLVH